MFVVKSRNAYERGDIRLAKANGKCALGCSLFGLGILVAIAIILAYFGAKGQL